jgi:hypothetical protein
LLYLSEVAEVMRCEDGEKFHLLSTLDDSAFCRQQYSVSPCQRKVFVETLPGSTTTPLISVLEIHPKRALIGCTCASNSTRPRSVGTDPHRCPRITQVH